MTVGHFVDRYLDNDDNDKGVAYLAQHELFDQVPGSTDLICFGTVELQYYICSSSN